MTDPNLGHRWCDVPNYVSDRYGISADGRLRPPIGFFNATDRAHSLRRLERAAGHGRSEITQYQRDDRLTEDGSPSRHPHSAVVRD